VTFPKSILGTLGACLLALAVFAGTAEAQTGRITGVVTDQATGQPLAGAQVFVEGTGRGAITQDNGRYFILNVQPGVYTVTAQLIGYATIRRQNVQVSIDVARTVDFELVSEAVAIDQIVIELDRTPMIETRASGSSDLMSLADIASLPVTDLNQALALRSGFLEVPQNTDIISQVDESRGLSPVRIRGGRAGETLTLIDGVPVNNFIFGGPAFQPSLFALRQVDYIRGGFEPQYGNALSGIINIATREGGTELDGTLEYRTSALAGALGSRHDELRGRHLFQGAVAGPVPGTNDRLRFSLAGREDRGAHRVLQYDDEFYNPRGVQPLEEVGFISPHVLDLWSGWRGFGYDEQRDLFGKFTFLATPAARLNLTAIDYQRQQHPFQANRIVVEGNPVQMCIDIYGDAELCQRSYGGNFRFGDVVGTSVELQRRLLALNWDHTLGTMFYRIGLSRVEQGRETCNYFQGACLEHWFANHNFDENLIAPGATPNHPAAGTGDVFGGESLTSHMARFDVQSQFTDNHNVQAGLFYQTHDVGFRELRNIASNEIIIIENRYAGTPWEFGAYVQDVIEYDFITMRLGFRFDVGSAGGLFLSNPMDPTAGTTAREVCTNPHEWQNVRVRMIDPTTGLAVERTLSADPSWTWEFCSQNRAVLSDAALIATADDFAPARQRRQFSPRLGLNFPVTERSSFFMNYGRYTQNPLYNNVYQATGIGTEIMGTPDALQIHGVATAPYLGNTNLVVEETTSYEIGYLAEIMDDYAFQVFLFSKDQTGLTGVRRGGIRPDGSQVHDPGVTYGRSDPRYTVLVNQDFATTRGFETSLRRRLAGHWGFDLNYSFSRSMNNASPPDRQAERIDEFEDTVNREIISEIDQPHVFNASLRFATGRQPLFDGTVGSVLRNIVAAATFRAASGLPYTPVDPAAALAFAVANNRRELNSGRMPATMRVDLQAQKDFAVQNMRYGAFLQVENLFDQQNCIAVSPATGDCKEGAYDFYRRRVGNPVGAPSSTSLDRPNWIAGRRSIMTGVRVSF
jgi:hypothetical protein